MTVAACACGGLDTAAPPDRADAVPDLLLHLPSIHCAACIATAERTLRAQPGVIAARVNMSLRRAFVTTDGRTAAGPLIAALEAAGLPAAELDEAALRGKADPVGRDLVTRMGVAGFAMMNVMLLSVAVWSGAVDATRQVFHLISALIAVPAVAYAARPFFAGALRSLRAGRLGMDVPIALAIALAALLSVIEAVTGGEHAWFDAALSLTFFLLVGRVLDHHARKAARSAASALSALDVPRATRITARGPETVRSDALLPGDIVQVLPGMGFPADGRIVTGASEIDRSAMTGESLPVAVGGGSAVQAGEINLSGVLTVEVERAGQDTSLSRMARTVAVAEAARGRYASLADRAARWYAPAVHLLALVALVGWGLAGIGWFNALGIAVAVLIVTCPCALGLAVPAVSVAASGRLFRAGCLVTSATALERLAEVDTVVFDKTGTLTGALRVDGAPPEGALRLAMGLAAGSGHPVSRAILAHGAARGLTPLPVEALQERPGQGIEGTWQGRPVRLGRPDRGRGVALDGPDGAHVIHLSETVPEGTEAMVKELARAGYRLILLSGDAPETAQAMGATLGIAEARGGLTPEDKRIALEELAARGRKVLMVGDGFNDTPALTAAHAAIAPGTALDAARAGADVICLSGGVLRVPLVLRTARTARRRMRGNLDLSLAYNAVAVPIALAGLATPLIAALAMSTSSITVSLNALRLGR